MNTELYIKPSIYYKLDKTLRDKLSARLKVFCGVVIQEDDKILLVKESGHKYKGYDFPGGKLMWGENLFTCAIREVLEETGYKCKLTGIVGIYQKDVDMDDQDYLRVIFCAQKYGRKSTPKDVTVTTVSWIKISKLNDPNMYRGVGVMQEINDYLNGSKYPIDMIKLFKW